MSLSTSGARSRLGSWRRPRSLTSLLPLVPNEVETVARLERELQRIGDAVDEMSEAELPSVPSLHFFRMQLLPDAPGCPPRLLFNTVFDGRLDAHLDDLLRYIGDWLGALLQRHCGLDAADGAAPTQPEITAFLQRHRLVENAIYLGEPGGTAEDVRQEHHLRRVLGDYVDARVAAGDWAPNTTTSAESLRLDLRRHVLASDDPGLPRAARPGLSWWERVLRGLGAVRAFILTFFGPLHGEVRRRLLPAGVPQPRWRWLLLQVVLAVHYLWTRPVTWLGLLMVRDLERQEEDRGGDIGGDAAGDVASDIPGNIAVPDLVVEKVRVQLQREDHQVQNPLTAFLHVRTTTPLTGTFRRLALRLVLAAANDATSHLWNQGRLAGIDTIHCARLIQYEATDGSQRFLFLSDYDGSWDRYLGDFLGIGRLAVVPIFTHQQDCPPTRWLLQVTPGFAPRFMTFIRRSMWPVQLWYSAWPEISMSNRLSNHRLRDGLFADTMSDAEAADWLRELDR